MPLDLRCRNAGRLCNVCLEPCRFTQLNRELAQSFVDGIRLAECDSDRLTPHPQIRTASPFLVRKTRLVCSAVLRLQACDAILILSCRDAGTGASTHVASRRPVWQRDGCRATPSHWGTRKAASSIDFALKCFPKRIGLFTYASRVRTATVYYTSSRIVYTSTRCSSSEFW